MDWITVLKLSAGVTTALSACTLLGALYLWLASQKREKSLRYIVDGENVVAPDQVIGILKTFLEDEARLGALKAILGNDEEKSKRIIAKVKKDVDVGQFSLKQQDNWTRQLLVVGLILLLFGIIGGGYGILRGSPARISPTTQPDLLPMTSVNTGTTPKPPATTQQGSATVAPEATAATIAGIARVLPELPASVRKEFVDDIVCKAMIDVPAATKVGTLLTCFFEPDGGKPGFVKIQLIEFTDPTAKHASLLGRSVPSQAGAKVDKKVYHFRVSDQSISVVTPVEGDSPLVPELYQIEDVHSGDIAAVVAIYDHDLVSGKNIYSGVADVDHPRDWTAVEVKDLSKLGDVQYHFFIGSQKGTITFKGAAEFWRDASAFHLERRGWQSANRNSLSTGLVTALKLTAAQAAASFPNEPYHTAFLELSNNALRGSFWATDFSAAQRRNVVYVTEMEKGKK